MRKPGYAGNSAACPGPFFVKILEPYDFNFSQILPVPFATTVANLGFVFENPNLFVSVLPQDFTQNFCSFNIRPADFDFLILGYDQQNFVKNDFLPFLGGKFFDFDSALGIN